MVFDSKGLNHIRKRRNGYIDYEKYPHPNKWMKIIDKIVIFSGFAGFLITLPQITRIWIDNVTAGVSLVSWMGYFVIAVTWIIYGLVHKEKSIIITNVLWVLAHTMIIVGLLIYG
ncbi:MAG: hypothetical protein J7K00_04220 [Candidatus Diapherotrites archaeon]|nr:hypothetical protein [Candidatus Diapherotrites archaeon]